MKKFLVLYRMDMVKMREMMEHTSKEEQAKNMKEWADWMEKHTASFADSGAPVGRNKQVDAHGVLEVGNDIGGYSIVQAESIEAATEMLATGPHLKMPGSVCDVMPIMEMPKA